MKKIGIVIQARMNSSRLSGKTLKLLDNKTLIEWIFNRLKKTKIKNIILATGKSKKNLKLKTLCDRYNIIFFAGDEKNVLKRYYKVSKKYKLDAIIRICADNPFVDSGEINSLIESYKHSKGNKDYYFNHRNYESYTYADGFGAELIKFSTLEKLYNNVEHKYHKEHVTSWIWNNLKNFNIIPCKTNIDKKYHHIVCDINNSIDYKKIKNFIKDKRISINDNAEKISKLFSLYEIETNLNDLFNINRSLAGEENRRTLRYLKNNTPIKIKSFASGERVFDWKIPNEWKITNGFIKDSFGNKLIDIKKKLSSCSKL
jgi:spore coat polysaccharide biosynthesis protein SpsF